MPESHRKHEMEGREQPQADLVALFDSTDNENYQELRKQLFLIGKEKVQSAPQLYMNVDVEADGVPGHGSLLSIGAISPWDETFYVELQPQTEDFVPSQQEFCEEHGLGRARLLREGVPAAAALQDFVGWTNMLTERYRREPVLTGFNPWLEFGFLALGCQKAGIQNPYGTAPFDLKSYAPAIRGSMDWKTTAKSKLPAIILPAGDFTHHALEDSVYQQEVHYGLVGLRTALDNPQEVFTR